MTTNNSDSYRGHTPLSSEPYAIDARNGGDITGLVDATIDDAFRVDRLTQKGTPDIESPPVDERSKEVIIADIWAADPRYGRAAAELIIGEKVTPYTYQEPFDYTHHRPTPPSLIGRGVLSS